ncbi:MAG: ATP-binding protein [Halobacteriota archaeon]
MPAFTQPPGYRHLMTPTHTTSAMIGPMSGIQAFETVSGYTGDEIDSMNAVDFFEGGDETTAKRAISEAFETGRTRLEVEFATKHGATIPYEFLANAFERPDGEAVLAGIGRDRTVHVEYERRLKDQRDNLEVLNQVVRHDIRNDLQLVTSYAELLDPHVEGPEREYLETVRESATHAVDLTETAREISDVMLTPADDRRPIRLRSVLEAEVNAVRSTHSDAVVTIDRSIPDVTVLANEMLHSVFRNLLKNALQHNDKPVPNVLVSVTDRQDAVAIAVADNGPGVPADRRAAIFDKGRKGMDSEGTGLGLYLVQRLVGTFGGDVSVEANDPEGAIFVVKLPTIE